MKYVVQERRNEASAWVIARDGEPILALPAATDKLVAEAIAVCLQTEVDREGTKQVSGFEDFALDFADFHEKHGRAVTRLLQEYVQRTRENVVTVKDSYAEPILAQAADRAQQALDAWEELTREVTGE